MLTDPQLVSHLEGTVSEILRQSDLIHRTEQRAIHRRIKKLAEYGMNRIEILVTLGIEESPENLKAMTAGWVKGTAEVKKALYLNATLGDNEAIALYLKIIGSGTY